MNEKHAADLIEAHRLIEHLILDRDGVLNEESVGGGYVSDPESFRWLPGALEGLALLRTLGVRLSVATNQSGIGRGLLTEAQLEAVHRKMCREAQDARGSIDAVLHCPHAPNDGCACRKPAPGLIVAAVAQSGIPLNATLFAGDDARDLEAGRAAGVRTVLLRTGKGRRHEALAASWGMPVFDDLLSLARELTVRAGRDRQADIGAANGP
jgi:D-glycero-D-manno-heptose 1,7-bisphosphate phosphatase